MALIEVRSLTKLYRMGDSVVRALDGVDLTIETGEFVAITGASGSGKSTMMHLLGCLDRPTHGSYVLNGNDVSRLSDRELAHIRNKYIGFVFQTFNLINRTSAVENVGVPLFYARKSNAYSPAREALERVGLGKRYRHKPSELSGGERQRVAIARAIVNSPVFLLADEPTGNLDTRTGEQIMEIFHSLNAQGVTIVLVTHEADVAQQAKRIVQMRDGRIVSDAPVERRVIASSVGRDDGGGNLDARAWEHDELSGDTVVARPAAINEPPRLARGANGALIWGVLAILLFIASIGATLWLAKSGVDSSKFNEKNPPPPAVIVAGFTSFFGFLGAIVSAIVAVVWGRAVRWRIRNEPGNWVGGRRALTALSFGWLTIATPLAYLAFVLVRLALRSASA